MASQEWTDFRTGNVWQVTLSGGTGVGARGTGDYLPEVVPLVISFRREDERHDLKYQEADKPLDKHSDEELQELLDRARQKDGSQESPFA